MLYKPTYESKAGYTHPKKTKDFPKIWGTFLNQERGCHIFSLQYGVEDKSRVRKRENTVDKNSLINIYSNDIKFN